MTIDKYLQDSQELISHAKKNMATDPAKSRRLLAEQLEQHLNLLGQITSKDTPKGRA